MKLRRATKKIKSEEGVGWYWWREKRRKGKRGINQMEPKA